MNKFKAIVVLLLFSVLNHFGFSQSRTLDSLELKLRLSKSDTSSLWLKNLIAEEYFNFNPDTAYKQWSAIEKVLTNKISFSKSLEKKSFQRTLAEVNNSIGAYYYIIGNPNKAIEYWNKSIDVRKELKDDYGITLSQLNIGFFYYNIKDLAQAIEYWQKAEVGAEKIENFTLQSSALSNIAGLYGEINEYEKSKNLFLKLIDIKLKNKTNESLETDYFNLASSCYYLKDYINAWKYVKKANELSYSKNILQEYSSSLCLIGDLYGTEGFKDSSLFYYKKSYSLIKEKTFNQLLSYVANRLANFYIGIKDYDIALKYAAEAYNNSRKSNTPKELNESAQKLSMIYEKKGNLTEAYKYYKIHIVIRDSMENKNKETDLFKKQLEFDTEREKINYQKEQEKRELLVKEEKQKQLIILYSVCVVLVFAVLLIIFILRGFKQKQKANIELEMKNDVIARQKEMVDEKQKEIVDSINYAKRIQYALLAHEDMLQKNLPEHFVYFNPKDIVSGDFYWATEHQNKFYLAVCDSTGHGVPGAFMSLLNIGFLNEAIKEKNIANPNEVLNYVRQRLIQSIGNDGQKDGMDAILLCFDKILHSITYSSANNAPLLISGNQAIELSKDKMPVGKGERTDSFTLYTIDGQKGDILYLYTDGYADQFGGPKGKKFKYKPLNELLLSICKQDMTNQKNTINSTFLSWKGNLEQVDDVCVVGIKL